MYYRDAALVSLFSPSRRREHGRLLGHPSVHQYEELAVDDHQVQELTGGAEMTSEHTHMHAHTQNEKHILLSGYCACKSLSRFVFIFFQFTDAALN